MTATLLFIPAPLATAGKTVLLSTFDRIKLNVIARWEVMRAARKGDLLLTDYRHRRRLNTNRGDWAIGLAIRQQLNAVMDSATVTEVGWDDVSSDELEAIGRRHDQLVIGGGGYIFLNARGELNARSRDLDVLLRLQDVKVIAYGIGLNRLMHEETCVDFRRLPAETVSWIRRFSDRCAYLSVRDHETARLFWEVADRRVPLVGDPALSLAGTARRKSSLVGINVAAHGFRALHCLRHVMPIFESHYMRLRDAGKTLRFFVHDDGDYPVIEYLRRRGHQFEVVDSPVGEMVTAYAECSFVLNQMLHSSILSFAAGTPAFSVAYDLKAKAFFDDFGLSAYCVPWSELDERKLQRASTAIEETHTSIMTKIETVRSERRADQVVFLQQALAG